MPKKIIEREIIDEEESLSGSETTYEEPEVKPSKPSKAQPKTKEPKQKVNRYQEKKKELSLEDLVAIELNKRNRTTNATKARIAKTDDKLIETKVNQRLEEAERKRQEKLAREKEIEYLVQHALAKQLAERNQLDEQIKIRAPKALRVGNKTKTKAPPKAPKARRQPRTNRSQEVDYQQPPQYYPTQPQPEQYYPQSNNNYRNLFM